MTAQALNARRVQAAQAKPGQRLTLNDDLTPGLHLRVSGATGRKSWMLRYRFNGEERRRRIGRYPAMSLAEARVEARRRVAIVDAGEDPDRQRHARAGEDRSFRALCEMVLEAKAKTTRTKTQKLRRAAVDRYLAPAWGDRPANAISRADVIELTERIRDDGKAVTANRVRTIANLVFTEGAYREFGGPGYLVANPVQGTRPPVPKEPTRDRFLDRQEIAALWRVLGDQNPLTEAVGKLALLTGQRIGQVLRMRWDRIDGDVWETPPEHHKAGRRIMTPLSTEALKVLDSLRQIAVGDDWLFPSRGGSKLPHLTNVSSKTLQRVRKKTGFPHWTWHDLRRTLRVWLVSAPTDRRTPGLGVLPHVADAVLTHKEDSLGLARYVPSSQQPWYLYEDKRAALEQWGTFVRRAVEEHGGEGAEAA